MTRIKKLLPKPRFLILFILSLTILTLLLLHFFALKKVLIIGFEPYDGHEVNSSWEAIKAWQTPTNLVTSFFRFRYSTLELPVDLERARKLVDARMIAEKPDIILIYGVSYQTKVVRLETIAHGYNKRTLKTGLPISKLKESLEKKNIQAATSKNAGYFVCNAIFYRVMNNIRLSHLNVKAGFIHLPDVGVNGFTKEVLGKVVNINIQTII